MEKTLKQIEKNISTSFSYVKKDMMMLNDAFSDLHDKIQKLASEQKKIFEEIERIKKERKSSKKKSSSKKNTKKK